MKKIWIVAASVCALAFSSAASAQLGSSPTRAANNGYAFTVRAGGAIAVDTNLNNSSRGFFGLGIDYTFEQQLLKNADTFLSVDWLTNSFNNSNQVQIFPINLNERFWLNENAAGTSTGSNRTYGFVGLGADIIDAHPSNTVFGGRVGLGILMRSDFCLEFVFNASAATRGSAVHATYFGGYLGYRF